VEILSLRPWRPFFANFAVTSFRICSEKQAFNRKDRKGNAKIAKKGVFWTCSTGISSLEIFSYQALPITATRRRPRGFLRS
jgi:hypothetical protein